MKKLKVVIFGLIFFSLYFHFCGKKQYEVSKENYKIKKKINNLDKTNEKLKEENEQLKKDSVVEKIAREKYKLQKKDEKVIHFIEEK